MKEQHLLAAWAGSWLTGFVVWSLPYMQWLSFAVGIVAGVLAIRAHLRRSQKR